MPKRRTTRRSARRSVRSSRRRNTRRVRRNTRRMRGGASGKNRSGYDRFGDSYRMTPSFSRRSRTTPYVTQKYKEQNIVLFTDILKNDKDDLLCVEYYSKICPTKLIVWDDHQQRIISKNKDLTSHDGNGVIYVLSAITSPLSVKFLMGVCSTGLYDVVIQTKPTFTVKALDRRNAPDKSYPSNVRGNLALPEAGPFINNYFEFIKFLLESPAMRYKKIIFPEYPRQMRSLSAYFPEPGTMGMVVIVETKWIGEIDISLDGKTQRQGDYLKQFPKGMGPQELEIPGDRVERPQFNMDPGEALQKLQNLGTFRPQLGQITVETIEKFNKKFPAFCLQHLAATPLQESFRIALMKFLDADAAKNISENGIPSNKTNTTALPDPMMIPAYMFLDQLREPKKQQGSITLTYTPENFDGAKQEFNPEPKLNVYNVTVDNELVGRFFKELLVV